MKYVSIGERCTGCGACADKCPSGAISMALDAKKCFVYPIVDDEKCVGCEACTSVCPVLRAEKQAAKDYAVNPIAAYAAYNNDTEIRMKSSSGGVFYLLASEIVKRGGVVAGAAYDDKFKVRHVFAENDESIKNLLGSKYSQSDTAGIFRSVQEYLDRGITVLFSGTPCQIAALKSAVGVNDRLYTVEVICHGVPSPEIHERYLSEAFEGETIFSESHRDKTEGWRIFSVKIETDRRVYRNPVASDYYMRLFLQNMILRESCYDCRFKNFNSSADITLGDFWGIGRIAPDMFDDKGCSAVIINTDRGAELFDLVRGFLKIKEVELQSVVNANAALNKSAVRPDLKDECMSAFDVMTVAEVAEKYTTRSRFSDRLKIKLKNAAIMLLGKIKR